MDEQEEEGWPLGLQPINARVGLSINRDFILGSFNTLLTASPTCSTNSSSDLDTESTGSFFHDKSITLGSLIGARSIVELSRRSLGLRKPEPTREKTNRTKKSRTLCFSWCASNSSVESHNPKSGPSLGHFLEVERKAANNGCRMNHLSPEIYAPDEIALAQTSSEPNSLFIDGFVAPPRSSPRSDEVQSRVETMGRDRAVGCGGIGLLF